MKSVCTAAVVAVALATGVLGQVQRRQQGGLQAVTTRGNAFYQGDERFYIRGVAYQPGGAADAQDPLLDLDTLRNDIVNFQELGINTIRIYTIDNSANHDEAMQLLDDAGIYLALDANTPAFSLNRENIDSLHASYNDVYLQSVFATIDAFAGYDNLLLFFSGNEVINAANNTNSAPYIKAVTRDMKRYIGAHADRRIPVGYSSADVAENIENQATYFVCGDDENARADFFAFNDYSWCDPSSFTQSGWDRKVETYSDFPVPLFLSEFGCITGERQWEEIAALYSTNMTAVYSGGLAYEYTLEENGYGLVEMGSDGTAQPNADFDRLKAAYEATPNPTGDGGARTDVSNVTACPARSDDWEVDTENLPEMPEGAEQYITNGAGTGPGLSDKTGSQWAGTPSTTNADLSDGVTSSEATNNTSSGTPSSTGTSSSASSPASATAAASGTGAADSAADSLKVTVGSATLVLVAALALLY